MLSKGQTSAVSMVLVAGIVLAMVVTTYQWGTPLVEKSQTNSKIVQAQDVMTIIKQKVDEVALSGEQKSFTVNLDGTLEVAPEKNSIIYHVSTAGLGIGSFSYVALDSGTEAVGYDTYAVNATLGGIAKINNVDYDVKPCGGSSTQVMINTTTYKVGDTIVAGYILEHVDCSNLFDGFTVITGPEREITGVLGADEPGVVMARTVIGGVGYTTQMRLMYRELDDTTTLEGQKINITSSGNKMASAGSHTITIKRGDIERTPAAGKLGRDLVTTKVYVSIS